MGDSLITIIAIFLAAVLIFVFPLMSMSEKTDNVSQLVVETATTDFVDNVRSTGKLTLDNYDKFVQEISSTGNSYDVTMTAQILDENPGVKTTQVDMSKIGENSYYNKYTVQILEDLNNTNNTNHTLTLKEGDIFSVSVKNTNKTISQTIKTIIYKVSGNNTYDIAAQHAGMVTTNGSK